LSSTLSGNLKFTPKSFKGFPSDNSAKYKAMACGRLEQKDGLAGREDDNLYKSRAQVGSPLFFTYFTKL